MAVGGNVISLSTLDWTLGNGANVSNVTASFPSQAHLDLFRAGVIGDPLYAENDYEQLWVQRSNWTYASSPVHGLSGGNGAQTWLLFEGLDTFTYIELCGQAVGNTANQFRQYYFDVSDILANCQAQPALTLNFGSATKIVLEIANSSAADQNVNFVNGVNGQEFQGKIYARKEQNDFGWDWSPSFAPAGPWQPASFIQTTPKELYIRNTMIDIYRQGQMNNLPPDQSKPWIVNASCDVLGTLPESAVISLDILDLDGHKIAGGPLSGITKNNETITGSMTVDPDDVEVWWPNGFGSQTMYNATISIQDSTGSALASTWRRIGFRTIVLNLSPVSNEQLAQGVAPGSNWHFEINGHELYAKGSNLVPPDTFWPRVNETKMRQLFEAVQNGNQNLLRVWSSGAYLPDFVYDIADEMGILLWCEFEFSDAEYPTNSTDLENYEAEAYHNVRRVNHHPSMALWAGGNELEQIQLAYFFDFASPGYILQQYQHIFEELLIKCVYANSRSISYIPSSTYHGYLDLNFSSVRPQTPRYLNTSGSGYLYANSDYYDYDTSHAFDFFWYPIGRFANEFGFISMPSLESWQEITTDDQLTGVEAEIVVHRNRHTSSGSSVEEMSLSGLEQMTGAIPQWFPVPNKADHLANFSAWSYATQVFQADYYTHQIAFYRRGSGMRERQLGALYWQLEDLWVAPTWSSIEANGKQKLLYHAAKDIFEPVIIYGYLNMTSNELEVWVTSDLWSGINGTAKFEMYDFNGNPIAPQQAPETMVPGATNISSDGSAFSVPFSIGPLNATQVAKFSNASVLFGQVISGNSSASKYPAAGSGGNTTASLPQSLLRLSIQANALSSSPNSPNMSETYSHSSIFHPTSLAQSHLPDPGLEIEHIGRSESDDDGGGGQTEIFNVTATKAVAAWVNVEYKASQVQGYFDRNAFWLAKGESREVRFVVWEDWTGNGGWVEEVSVGSLWDLTTP